MNFTYPITDMNNITAMSDHLKLRDERLYILWIIGISTALRISDLVEIRTHQIVGESLKFKEHLVLKERKRGKIRQIKLPQEIRPKIKEYIEKNDLYVAPPSNPNDPDIGYLFKTVHNTPLSRKWVWKKFNEARMKVGIKEPIGTHCMRKTMGYHFYERTHDIALLMRLLEHSTEESTLRYIGKTQSDIDSAMANTVQTFNL
jgi:integrase